MKRYLPFIVILIASLTACERIYVTETDPKAPTVTSFTPESAPVGAEVIVYGESLSEVTSASIGSVPVTIIEKVSDKRLSIRVSQGVTSGKITLSNALGSGVSEKEFHCSFAVPTITTSLLQAQADMGDRILISGQHLASAKNVFFTADGYTAKHEAPILTSSDKELVVRVPYVEAENAKITLTYFDGTSDKETSLSSAPSIRVMRYVPRFDPYSFKMTAVGKSIVLTGEYLNNIEKITVGDFEAPLFKDANQLTFTIPGGDFADGQTDVVLKAWYFEGNESIILADPFTVYVPFVKIWENVRIWAQGRTETNEYRSFFSPETGIAYENSQWKETLDPIAMKYKNTAWVAANTPKEGVVSDEEYNSVVPYFFFSGNNDHSVALQSPANSNSQLKNFYISFAGTPANDYRVPGSNDNMPGTPILAYRYLNPNSDSQAEKDLINKVLSGQIENINEQLFPIDVTANTIAGISVASMAGNSNSSTAGWVARDNSSLVDEKDYKLNAIFLVAYYSNCGYVKTTPTQNIKRLGIIHVTSIDWGVYNNQNYGGSCFTLTCYWQKYDYDYSKL